MAGLALAPQVAVLLGLALVGAWAVDAAFARSEPRVSREISDVVSRGVQEPFAIHAEAPRWLSLRVHQAAPRDLELRPAEGAPPLRGQLLARRRGPRRLTEVGVRIEGPLGLAAFYRREGGEREVRVFPDLPAARRAVATVRQARYRDQGLRSRGALGLGTEFERVRDYSPDDDIRQVNWRATARLAHPMSNDYRLEQDRDVIALVDCGRLMSAPAGSGTLLDAALDSVTALGAVADELGDRFGAIAFDSELRRELPPRRGGGGVAVRSLFDLEPRPVDSDYARAFQAARASKRAFVIVLTDLLEEVAARPLLEAVPVLSRRHALAVASVADPDVDAAIRLEPRAELDAYRAAAALDVLAARRRVAVLLARSGAQVIEAPEAGFAPACVKAYLRAKSRALL